MKTYKSQQEVEADIKDGSLKVDDDITFKCDITIKASIVCRNITAGDIDVWDIIAGDIKARDIDAWHIDAGDINTGNIIARSIDVGYINFYAICSAYNSFKCNSIKGRRKNSKYFCLDSEVVIRRNK